VICIEFFLFLYLVCGCVIWGIDRLVFGFYVVFLLFLFFFFGYCWLCSICIYIFVCYIVGVALGSVRALAQLCGKDMGLPMNSGAEAVESGIKVARKWGTDVKGVPA